MRRTKEEADQTRQALLDAALTIFSKKGYQAAGLQEIAEAAGVTRGAIYHHFGGKSQMFITLLEEAQMQMNGVINQAIAAGGDFIEVSTRILVNSWSYLEENRRYREIVAMYNNFKTDSSPELEALTQRTVESLRMQVEGIKGYMQMGIDQGVLRADIDPETIARAFLAYQEGVVSVWFIDRNAFSIKEIAPALASIFVQGISAVA